MERRLKAITALFAASLVLAVVSANAYAYIDPGTGSYILQIVMAAFFTAIFAIGVYWQKFKAFVFSRFGRRKDDATKDE